MSPDRQMMSKSKVKKIKKNKLNKNTVMFMKMAIKMKKWNI